MPKARLLIVDDDPKLNRLLCDYLSKQGYACESAFDGEEGLRRAKRNGLDLLVLDVMLPGKDGFELLLELRQASSLPVLMLTARGEVADKVSGLRLGADDYLAKPFEPSELLARVEAVLSRGRGKDLGEVMESGELKLDAPKRRALLKDRELDLTTLEFDLLELFVRSRGRVLTRDAISEAVKGFEAEAFDRSVDVAVSRLRDKLGDHPRKARFIKTVWGKGYQWVLA